MVQKIYHLIPRTTFWDQFIVETRKLDGSKMTINKRVKGRACHRKELKIRQMTSEAHENYKEATQQPSKQKEHGNSNPTKQLGLS